MPDHDALEVQVTALLLGELSADEAKTLRARIEADPALRALHDRLRIAIELTREATRPPQAKEAQRPEAPRLDPARRDQLLAKLRTPAAPPQPDIIPLPTAAPSAGSASRCTSNRREWLAMAAMLAVLLATAAGVQLFRREGRELYANATVDGRANTEWFESRLSTAEDQPVTTAPADSTAVEFTATTPAGGSLIEGDRSIVGAQFDKPLAGGRRGVQVANGTVDNLEALSASNGRDAARPQVLQEGSDAPVLLAEWRIQPDTGRQLSFRQGSLTPANGIVDNSAFTRLPGLFSDARNQPTLVGMGILLLVGAFACRWSVTMPNPTSRLRRFGGPLMAVAAFVCARSLGLQLHHSAPVQQQAVDNALTKGPVDIDLTFQFRTTVRDGVAGLVLPTPHGLVNRVNLTLADLDVDVSAPDAVSIDRQNSTSNTTSVRIILAPATDPWIAWRPRSRVAALRGNWANRERPSRPQPDVPFASSRLRAKCSCHGCVSRDDHNDSNRTNPPSSLRPCASAGNAPPLPPLPPSHRRVAASRVPGLPPQSPLEPKSGNRVKLTTRCHGPNPSIRSAFGATNDLSNG